jgi:CHASE2 domain-containing sensor protein
MELLTGTTLAEHGRARGPLPVEDALDLLEPIADAVDFAHRHDILHRDLKPANVFLQDDAGRRTVKLLDFGLARMLDRPPAEAAVPPRGPGVAANSAAAAATADLSANRVETSVVEPSAGPAPGITRPGTVLGTPHYMSPELASSAARDIYAFGVLAYELVVGRVPFKGTIRDVLRAHATQPPPRPSELRPGLPDEVDRALLLPLAKDPALRPRTARECLERLRDASLAARRREWRRRELPRRLAVALLLAALVVGLAAALPRLSPVASLEAATVDLRFRLARPRAPDPRLLLVVLDEASVAADPTPLPAMADVMGRRLEEVFRAGARAVALDLLLPASWSRSPEFSKLVLRHADAIALAAAAQPGGVVGPEAVQGITAVALGPERAAALFGLADVETDADGAVRRARTHVVGPSGRNVETFAGRASALLGVPPAPVASFWLDQAVDPAGIRRVSWAQLPAALARDRALLAGRLVLVGIDLTGSGDLHAVPVRGRVDRLRPGVELQALGISTILSGVPVRDAGPVACALALGAASLVGCLAVLACPRAAAALAVAGTVAAAGLAAALLSFALAGRMVPVMAPLTAFAAAGLLGALIRARLVPYPAARRTTG